MLPNFRAVSARARGPMKGRQPMVNVTPAAKTSTSTANTKPSVFQVCSSSEPPAGGAGVTRSPIAFGTIKTQDMLFVALPDAQ